MADTPPAPDVPPDPRRLTARQKRFVAEYAAGDGNATLAYFRAYGRKTRTGALRTYKGAQNAAAVLLSNPIISAEIEAAQAGYARAVRVSKLRVLRELGTWCVRHHVDRVRDLRGAAHG